jgi:hypothetical protein
MLARDAEDRWEESAERIFAEARFSPWLKQHLKRALARPPLEALEDAETLLAVLRGRLGEQLCGDPQADVPLPARDPLASVDSEEAGRRAAGSRGAESLLRQPDPSAWSLLRKRVVEVASLLGVAVEGPERRPL